MTQPERTPTHPSRDAIWASEDEARLLPGAEPPSVRLWLGF